MSFFDRKLIVSETSRPRLALTGVLSPGLQDSTTITRDQMATLVKFVLREKGLPSLGSADTTALVSLNGDSLRLLTVLALTGPVRTAQDTKREQNLTLGNRDRQIYNIYFNMLLRT